MLLKRILGFCKRYEEASTKVAFFLIALQLIHLVWLTTDIVLVKLLPDQVPLFPKALEPVQAAIDYLEIPGLFAAITIYVMGMARSGKVPLKNALFTAMLLVQFVHLFWITDEVVYEILLNSNLIDLPDSVAWVAILIDYLELPVMFDLSVRVFRKKK